MKAKDEFMKLLEACTQVDYRCAFSVVAACIPFSIHRLLAVD